MGFKHLTLTSRCMIEKYLNFGYSFREIAAEIGCQPSTISREVKNNRTIIKPKNPICRSYVECRKHTLCDRAGCTEQCKKCDVIRCVEQCEDYLPRTCSDLEKAPLHLLTPISFFAIFDMVTGFLFYPWFMPISSIALLERRDYFFVFNGGLPTPTGEEPKL